MKNSMKTLYAMMAVVITGLAVQSCGGGSDAGKGTAGTPEAGKEAPASASEDGIGSFAGKDVAAFDASMVENGKKIFESKCAACHKTTEEKVVGPGLKGVTERRNAKWILNMITNPEEMTKKDPVAQALLAEHLTQMTNQNITEADAIALLNYLRSNDGAK